MSQVILAFLTVRLSHLQHTPSHGTSSVELPHLQHTPIQSSVEVFDFKLGKCLYLLIS